MAAARKRDLIGIGGSAGALPALVKLLETFRPESDASVFVVLHRAAESEHLDQILAKSSHLEVCEPTDGDKVRPNCLYLARTDCHMTVGENHIHLRRGPRENNFRPAIDPLFRSLAVFGSTRSTAVVLSGYLDDGAAGARAIADAGGAVMVQDPAEAMSASMPRAAISAVGEPECIASAENLGRELARIVSEDAGPPREADPDVRLELMIAGMEKANMQSEQRLGELSPYNCPDCNGVLWEIEDGPLLRYRCHTGHAFSSGALSHRQEEALEQRLFDSLRATRERVRYVENLAKRDPVNSRRWKDKAQSYREDCDLIETLIKRRQNEHTSAGLHASSVN
ncbi:MAG: chemotaxis protein CheB [Erythrobacter sp.]|uniref:chemotaxis protein CheB n=1 Tax=Erythrobacter sp. TaxID=1042 RepID=UPI003C7958F4